MARTGGAATLSGVEYQVLYTASRLAEALTQDDIISLRPEAHHTEFPVPMDGQPTSSTSQQPAVDDLLIIHRNQPTEYISLKYRDGLGMWDTKQLAARKILHDFLEQHQQDPVARLLLVSQSPIDRDLDDCVERANTAVPASLEVDLGIGPYRVFKEIESYLQRTIPKANLSRNEVLRLLQQVELHVLPASLLTTNLLLRLQPHVKDATAVKNCLTTLALSAGASQQLLTPEIIRKELRRQNHSLIVPPAFAEVLAQLRQASSSLTSQPATIGHLPTHHITRLEVANLLSWVLSPLPSPLPEQSPASRKSRILIGGAGVGKTVLARAICLALQAEDIPVLALKADRVKGNTKGELLSQIQSAGLLHPLAQALAVVSSPERPAVVIIDQLDALSMCLSAERGPLNSYTELLTELYDLPHVRFILSCRTFDLQHDPDLASFQQAQRIEIPLLSLLQVEEALQATQVAPNLTGMAPVLQELLRVPLHLALYCALDADDRSGTPITSLQGLYGRLFDDFLVRRNRLPTTIESSRVKKYLTSLAVAMHRDQTLTLPRFRYREQDEEVFEYLCSRGVLAVTGPASQQIAFFHQSFFEYLFARQFEASGQPLADFVLNSGQGLFQRSLIQQVLVYLRGIESPQYAQALRQLLSSTHCRFHIKLLLTQQVAAQLTPYTEEQVLVQELVLTDGTLQLAFLEAVSSRRWLVWLTSPTVLQQLVPTVVALNDAPLGRALFWRLTNHAPDLALEQVNAFPNNEHKADWLAAVLPHVKAFKHPLFVPLFDQLFQGELAPNQHFDFWQILQKAASKRPDWTAAKMYEQLANWPDAYSADSQREDYQQAETFKELYKAAPQVCFNLSSQLLRRWIKHANHYREPHFRNWKSKYTLLPAPYFLERDALERDEPHNAPGAVQYYVWKYLVESDNPLTAQNCRTVIKWLNSRTKTLVKVALATAVTKPAPFTNALIALFTKPGWLAEAAYRSIGYYTLTVLPMVWDAASFAQRQQLSEVLTSSTTLVDFDIYEQDGRRRFYTRFGRATLRYLLALTPARLGDFPDLLRFYKQLLHKWGNIPNDKPKGISVTSGYPSPAQNWKIGAVTAENWLKALRKYRAAGRSFYREKGTYEGLINQLTNLVKEAPVRWQPLIQYLVEQHDESVAALLPVLNDGNIELAHPLIEQAHQAGLLADEAVHYIRRNNRIGATGKRPPADLEDVRAYLEQIRGNLTTPPTISGDKIYLTTYALNSPGGGGAFHLLQEKLPDEVIPEVLDTLRIVAADGSRYVRAGAAHHVAMLLNAPVPPKELVSLFVSLIGADYELLEPGLWSLQYLVWRDYETILALFQQAIAEEEARDPMAQILTIMWAHGKPGAYELLEKLWAIAPDLRAISFRTLFDGYRNSNWPDKQIFFEAFALFLTPTPTEKLRRVYDFTFAHLSPIEFSRIAPLIKLYLASCASDFDRDHFLVDYLAKNVQNHPVKCIALLDSLFSQIPVTRNYWPAKKALEVLIEAYTILPHHTADNADCRAALDLFDKLLARPDCREELDKTLEQVQSPR